MSFKKFFYPRKFILEKKQKNSINFLNAYKMAIDKTSIVSKTNLDGVITYVNRQFCEISGYREDELLGFSHNIIRHPDVPKEVFKEMWRKIQNREIWRGIIKNRKKSGDSYIVNATIIPVVDENKNIIEYIAVRHNITELMKTKEKLAQQKIDILTKLPNKNAFLEEVKEFKKPILFYLNIDDFMSLNNLYGNKIGDRVLVHMANLLKDMLKDEECKIYRVYNDEFLILCEEGEINIDNYKEFLLEIINSIERNTLACNAPECIGFTLSGGVSYYKHNSNYENLSLLASIARNIAKQNNRKILLYSHDMQNEEDYAKNIAWIKNIKKAIANNKFIPYFQPIQDNRTNKIVKYEALIRMIDDNKRIVTPFFFLEVAKKAKLYSTITRVVIDKSLNFFKDRPEYECSINLSTDDIMNVETRRYIYEKLKDYPHPQNIIFEITESEEIRDFKIVNLFIKRVRDYGVKISIDDFGTGYANFEYILNLNVDYIKIDGSLIKNIVTDKQSKIIVEAIIAFSKKLGTKTVVEYVSSQEIYDEVVSLGADYSQGYYIGKPQATLL
jgi:PAS domain S-box-containing protein/diguanylate cyclase (GGDEF)-like protein